MQIKKKNLSTFLYSFLFLSFCQPFAIHLTPSYRFASSCLVLHFWEIKGWFIIKLCQRQWVITGSAQRERERESSMGHAFFANCSWCFVWQLIDCIQLLGMGAKKYPFEFLLLRLVSFAILGRKDSSSIVVKIAEHRIRLSMANK